jgi:hypothetical protein
MYCLSPGLLSSSPGRSSQYSPTMHGPALDFDIDRFINRLVPYSRLHRLPKSISWILGYRPTPAPQMGSVLVWWWAFIGAFCGISVVEAVFNTDHLQAKGVPIVIASLVCLPPPFRLNLPCPCSEACICRGLQQFSNTIRLIPPSLNRGVQC